MPCLLQDEETLNLSLNGCLSLTLQSGPQAMALGLVLGLGAPPWGRTDNICNDWGCTLPRRLRRLCWGRWSARGLPGLTICAAVLQKRLDLFHSTCLLLL